MKNNNDENEDERMFMHNNIKHYKNITKYLNNNLYCRRATLEPFLLYSLSFCYFWKVQFLIFFLLWL